MKVHKIDLAQAISRIKPAVSKNSTIPTAHCILVNKGYLIANNLDMAVKIRLDGCENDYFLIPPNAFDMIASLPSTEVEITGDAQQVQIKAGRVKTKYQTYDPDLFTSIPKTYNDNQLTMKAEDFLQAVKNVSFAVDEKQTSNPAMCCICFHSEKDHLDVVGLDGHCIAWDKISYPGMDFELLIRKEHLSKITSLGLEGDISIEYGNNVACIKNEDVEFICRLVDKKYFGYAQMMTGNYEHRILVDKKELTAALARGRMCSGTKQPVIITMNAGVMQITARDASSDYLDEVSYEGQADGFEIAFNPELLIAAMKSFNAETITMDFVNKKAPVVMSSDSEQFRSLVLPVNFRK